MAIGSFIKAVEAEGPPPCEQYACALYMDCASQSMCCTAFAYYVRTGETLHPFIDIPERSTKKSEREFRDKPYPSRAIFLAVQEDTWGADQSERTENAKANRAMDAVIEAMDKANARGLDSWLHTSTERAETTMRRHREAHPEEYQE